MSDGLPDFTGIITANKCGFIPREKIGDATNGLLSPTTMAKLDSMRQGIKGRFRVGRKICYPTQAVVEFLKSRCRIVVDDKE